LNIRVVNVVCSGKFSDPQNLNWINETFENVWYDYYSFPGFHFLGKPRLVLFSSGKFFIAGAKSIYEARTRAELIADLLETKIETFKVSNIVALVEGLDLDFERLAKQGRYVPEANLPFVEKKEEGKTLLCYASGKIIVTNLKHGELENLPEFLRRCLGEARRSS